MPTDAFVDTNILVYAFTRDDLRTEAARQLLGRGVVLNVQVLNEFVNVARRKLRIPWSEIRDALAIIKVLAAPPLALTPKIHRHGVAIAERHHYRIYDALIIAAAVDAGCRTLYSEVLADGQVVDGVRIENPFASRA